MTGGYGVVATCVFSVDGETWIPTHVSFSFIFLNYTILYISFLDSITYFLFYFCKESFPRMLSSPI